MKFAYPKIEAISPDMRGFYQIDHDAYHTGPGISSTRVKKALISYAHYHHVQPDTEALAFGRAFHAALVEPEAFAAQWVKMPRIDGHPNSNAYKAEKADWLSANVGRNVMSDEVAATIDYMVTAVREHPEFAKLAGFDAEIMGITHCNETGLQTKCKVDLFSNVIVDFKTTSSGLSPSETLNDIVKWRYHVSAAFYQDIIYALTGERLPFLVVPVTKKLPFECEFYQLSSEVLEEGRKLYKAGLRRIKKWQDSQKSEEKCLRMLYPNGKMLYSTQDTINFLEGP
jgi:hypothetical protein